MFGELVGQPVSRLTDIEFIAKITATAIDKATAIARERVSNIEDVLFRSSEKVSVGEEKTGVIAGSRTRKDLTGAGIEERKVLQIGRSCRL